MREPGGGASGYVVAFFAAVAVVLTLVSIPDLDALPALACLGPMAILLVAHRRLQAPMLSPVFITVVILAGTGLFGYLFAPALAGLEGGGIELTMPEDMRVSTAYVFAASAAFAALGGAVGLALLRHRRIPLAEFEFSRAGSLAAVLLAMLPMVMVVGSLGSSLFVRPTYLAGEGGSNLFGFGQQLAVAAVAFLGYIVARKGGLVRVVAASGALGYLVLFFGLGSRRLALIPICFAVGYALAGRRRTWRTIVAALVIALAILPIPLFLRGGQAHGLVPYFEALGGFDYAGVDWAVTLNNLLIAFPISGFTAFGVDPIAIENLIIGLNPLPGELVGWYDISSTMNLNRWTPYSMVGELANYGAWAVVAVWFLVGLVLGVLEARISTYAREGYPLFVIGIVGLSALFALQSLQYTVRSSTRMLVYALATILIAEFIRFVRRRRHADSLQPRSIVGSVTEPGESRAPVMRP